MKQQMAVEYIIEQLSESGHLTNEAIYYCRNLIRQAKEIEKQQILNAYNKGNMQSEIANLYAEKYYKENYESNNRI